MPFLTDLCGCSIDVTGTLDVIFCHSCNIGRQSGAVHDKEDTLEMVPCILGCIFVPCMAFSLRRDVAAKYQIDEETLLGAFCRSFLCAPCSLCQTNRELNLQNRKTGYTCYEPNPKMN